MYIQSFCRCVITVSTNINSLQGINLTANQLFPTHVTTVGTVKKGDIFYANLSPVVGSEQGGIRPVVIIQNDIGNKFSPTVISAAITSHNKCNLPTHILIKASVTCGLSKDSIVLLEQIRTIDKRRLLGRLGNINQTTMKTIEHALLISLGLSNVTQTKADYKF
ncbi:MAG: type II toxin-antitoxin system PemK/MazF family toxin [Candidatus Improbicoccus devescovinae]|nr:MAG: type II toxin-antitoxin system PemK/MazF family toxin [Candidatus Improbicoccus devescovinae]